MVEGIITRRAQNKTGILSFEDANYKFINEENIYKKINCLSTIKYVIFKNEEQIYGNNIDYGIPITNWEKDKNYKVGDIVFNDKTYNIQYCIADHISSIGNQYKEEYWLRPKTNTKLKHFSQFKLGFNYLRNQLVFYNNNLYYCSFSDFIDGDLLYKRGLYIIPDEEVSPNIAYLQPVATESQLQNKECVIIAYIVPGSVRMFGLPLEIIKR